MRRFGAFAFVVGLVGLAWAVVFGLVRMISTVAHGDWLIAVAVTSFLVACGGLILRRSWR